jgi:signal transduction histidine kinase
LSLAPYEKNLEIRYAGLSFVTPEKVTFRYLLDGYDKEWIEAGSRREAFYTNLPPGHFRFRVIASSSDGVWSTPGASIDFTIQPLLYQRPWFFPLLAFLIGLATWLGYQLRIRNLKRQFRLVISERSRIARELHDTLLQGISGVTMQLQALWTRLPPSHEKEVLRDIIKDAGTCLSDARHSLWGLRSPAGTQEHSLAENLARHARQAVSGTPIRLVLEIQPAPRQLSPDLEYQLLRIAKEAVANSILHAEPKTIEIRLAFMKDNVELSIKDDGKGFDADTLRSQPGHYGLVGMRERANELGAKLVVTSMPGFGTEILVTAPVSTKSRPGAEAHDVSDEREALAKEKA